MIPSSDVGSCFRYISFQADMNLEIPFCCESMTGPAAFSREILGSKVLTAMVLLITLDLGVPPSSWSISSLCRESLNIH